MTESPLRTALRDLPAGELRAEHAGTPVRLAEAASPADFHAILTEAEQS